MQTGEMRANLPGGRKGGRVVYLRHLTEEGDKAISIPTGLIDGDNEAADPSRQQVLMTIAKRSGAEYTAVGRQTVGRLADHRESIGRQQTAGDCLPESIE